MKKQFCESNNNNTKASMKAKDLKVKIKYTLENGRIYSTIDGKKIDLTDKLIKEMFEKLCLKHH